MQPHYAPGQRWVNHAELQLGLGTIMAVEHRTITLMFKASGETRTYSKITAPLTRVIFSVGDKIKNHEGMDILVQSIRETEAGLVVYSGVASNNESVDIPEQELDSLVTLHGPKDRLLAGLIDEDKWFHLRYLTLEALKHLSKVPVIGISGCRIDLILHQLYIANEVSRRYAPRVLLADEVGLGKTIEAGLIIHQQLVTEQIQRVLIVVPENLLHQWLVEMLRRFNLRFSIYDEQRHTGMTETGQTLNPFEQEQLVLCSLDTLTTNSALFEDVMSAAWDMLVVDEAHHLEWSPEHPSLAYSVIASLSSVIKGVLLLTATPEQLGKAGHYARLRILDPDRFPDFDAFIDEEKNYEPIARAVESLFSDAEPDLSSLAQLENLFKLEQGWSKLASAADPVSGRSSRYELINRLLDHHGTGRVLFRNTRAAISGFPQRKLHPYPLTTPAAYLNHVPVAVNDRQCLLSPELAYMGMGGEAGHWTLIDPRINWLIQLLKDLNEKKALVITYSRQTAIDLAEVLRLKAGKYAAIFHEDMTIIERDRAAAYFANVEDGTQVLICSEIGSEGRNFQFAHHLILFDLPLNPEMLEQRIGRLDRIGQTQTIEIHVPFLEQTSQEIMFKWYQQGLQAFDKPCQTGQAIFEQVEDDLNQLLQEPALDCHKLIQATKQLNDQLNLELEKGRDRLLEYNSCRPDIASALYQQASQEDQSSTLPELMDKVFDCFGVHSEEHSEHSLILSPAENMIASFPHLPDEGLTVTYSRQTALIHENWQYLTWCHPMVISAMEMVLSYEAGNAALTSFKHPKVNPGTMLLECYFILESSVQTDATLRKLIPPQLISLLIDEQGRNLETSISHEFIQSSSGVVDKQTAAKIIGLKQNVIKNLIELCQQKALELAPSSVEVCREQTTSRLSLEINRLKELRKFNPNIREEEIEHLSAQMQKSHEILDSTRPRLDAIRVLVAT